MNAVRLLFLFLISALAQTVCAATETADSLAQASRRTVRAKQPPRSRVVEKQWLWGAGWANVLDTYLSPLTYKGTDLALLNRTERLARWGKGKVTVTGLYNGHAAYVASPTDDGKMLDAELSASGGWHYNWRPAQHWRLALGGLAELSGGFTYATRNSNNPAQARLGTSLWASGIAEYSFLFFGKNATARMQLDAQLVGAQFAPEYGQSYYEIFSLGHNKGIVHLTQMGNCPTYRAQAAVSFPVKKANVTLGYAADIRQSKLGGLKRHAWRNTFMIGYTRRLTRL